MERRWIIVVAAAAVVLSSATGPAASEGSGPTPAREQVAVQSPRSATVPFALDHNRMIVGVEFVRPDGTIRRASAWVDTGNQFFMLSEPLARELGLEVSVPEGGNLQYPIGQASGTPQVRLGGVTLDTEGIGTKVLLSGRAMPGLPAEANLPATTLRHDVFVLDYPRRTLTVARPGVLKPRGRAVPCRVNPSTGLFQIAATIDGEAVELAVDNGASYTWVSNGLVAAWQARHPDWPRATGAVGAASFFGFPFEAQGVLMRLPELRIGHFAARHVGVVGLDQALFDWYSTKTPGAVAGLIGANVLRGYRITLDLPNQVTYWQAGPAPEANDLDTVGLTLRPETDGSYTIVGVAAKNGKPTVDGVVAGDRLVQVGSFATQGASMGAVATALRGTPGTVRSLAVERDGKRQVVEATVTRFP